MVFDCRWIHLKAQLKTKLNLKNHVFRGYIENQWDRIFDWKTKVKDAPEGAKSLGAIESNQRRVSYRMKKRGMH